MWKNKLWECANKLLSLTTIAFIVLMVWRTLADTKPAAPKKNETLESIRTQLNDEEAWQHLKKPLEKSLRESKLAR
jgi:ABC-type nitrate/sulfonate/bicarbonate transport system permease component